MRGRSVVLVVSIVGIMVLLQAGGVQAAGPQPARVQMGMTAGDELPVETESCYWRELVTCSDCTYHFDCLVWYGWDNRFGEECIGRWVEYCYGVPSGIEIPILQLRCGC